MKLAIAKPSITGAELDLTAFEHQLDTIRETGFAFDLDEHAHGISAIVFAFIDLADDIQAKSVPVPIALARPALSRARLLRWHNQSSRGH